MIKRNYFSESDQGVPWPIHWIMHYNLSRVHGQARVFLILILLSSGDSPKLGDTSQPFIYNIVSGIAKLSVLCIVSKRPTISSNTVICL